MNIIGIGILGAFSLFFIAYYLLDALAGSKAAENRQFEKRIQFLTKPKTHSIAFDAKFSHIARLNRIFQREQMLLKLYNLLDLNGAQISVSVFLFSTMLLAFGGYFICFKFSHSSLLGVVLALPAGLIPFSLLVLNRKRYIEKFTVQFPQALTMMKNAIQGGQGIQAAFKIVAEEGPKPVSAEFARMIREMDLGEKVDEALRRLYQRIPSANLRIFVLGILIQQGVGGSLTDLFEHVERSIRARLSLSRELSALTAQGRMAGMVLTFLPMVVALGMYLLNPAYFKPLLEGDARKVLYAAAGFLAIGALTIRKMTKVSIAV